jgi:hypothetical protein
MDEPVSLEEQAFARKNLDDRTTAVVEEFKRLNSAELFAIISMLLQEGRERFHDFFEERRWMEQFTLADAAGNPELTILPSSEYELLMSILRRRIEDQSEEAVELVDLEAALNELR